jgi:hypothetical protein
MAGEMDRRMTVMEQQLLNMGRRLDEHMVSTNRMIEKIDDKQDRADLMMARMVGGLIVAQFLAILLGPALRAALGLA